jgi:hypothetical protein
MMESKKRKRRESAPPREPETGKPDITRHPRFSPMKEEDQLKPGEMIVAFVPRLRPKGNRTDRET